jgi:hypothetical protein
MEPEAAGIDSSRQSARLESFGWHLLPERPFSSGNSSNASICNCAVDAMAGDVVWRHIRRKDRLIATAAVDHLAWAGELIRLDKDLQIQGQVRYEAKLVPSISQ